MNYIFKDKRLNINLPEYFIHGSNHKKCLLLCNRKFSIIFIES